MGEVSKNEAQSLSLKVEVLGLGLRYVSAFRNHSASKSTGVGNRGHISHFLPPHPVKFR